MPVYKKVNKNFFKVWSSNMAYVLGFFAADGYITSPKQGGGFWCLDIKDKEHIEKIKIIIGAEHKISIRKRIDGTTYRLQIGSIEMCNDLHNLGFYENKTKNMAIPHIPKKYFSDFIRGYFDGDGNVWSGLIHKNRKTSTLTIQVVFTSCSYEFLEKIREKLEVFNIVRGVLRQGKRGKGNYYRLTYSVLNSLKLYNFMYNGIGTSKLFLKRKKDVFERYIKMRM